MQLFYSVFYYIYKNILGQKDFPDEEYVSALKTVLHPNYTKWLNAEGIDKDKKKECLEDLKHFLESIEVLKSYKLLNETLEDHRKYTLNNIEKQMLFLSTLIDLLEHRPAEYDIAVSYAKKYMYDQQESQKILEKNDEAYQSTYDEYSDDEYSDDEYDQQDNIEHHEDYTDQILINQTVLYDM